LFCLRKEQLDLPPQVGVSAACNVEECLPRFWLTLQSRVEEPLYSPPTFLIHGRIGACVSTIIPRCRVVYRCTGTPRLSLAGGGISDELPALSIKVLHGSVFVELENTSRLSLAYFSFREFRKPLTSSHSILKGSEGRYCSDTEAQ
jgi:hypothetical protein